MRWVTRKCRAHARRIHLPLACGDTRLDLGLTTWVRPERNDMRRIGYAYVRLAAYTQGDVPPRMQVNADGPVTCT